MTHLAQTLKKQNHNFEPNPPENFDQSLPKVNLKTENLDLIGIIASGICLIHCLALPLIIPYLSLFPLDKDHQEPEFFHFFIFQQTEQLSFIFLHLQLSDLLIIYYTVFFLIF